MASIIPLPETGSRPAIGRLRDGVVQRVEDDRARLQRPDEVEGRRSRWIGMAGAGTAARGAPRFYEPIFTGGLRGLSGAEDVDPFGSASTLLLLPEGDANEIETFHSNLRTE